MTAPNMHAPMSSYPMYSDPEIEEQVSAFRRQLVRKAHGVSEARFDEFVSDLTDRLAGLERMFETKLTELADAVRTYVAASTEELKARTDASAMHAEERMKTSSLPGACSLYDVYGDNLKSRVPETGTRIGRGMCNHQLRPDPEVSTSSALDIWFQRSSALPIPDPFLPAALRRVEPAEEGKKPGASEERAPKPAAAVSGSLENGDSRVTGTDQQAAPASARVLVGPPPPPQPHMDGHVAPWSGDTMLCSLNGAGMPPCAGGVSMSVGAPPKPAAAVSGSLENGDSRVTCTDQQAAQDSSRALVGPPPPQPDKDAQAAPWSGATMLCSLSGAGTSVGAPPKPAAVVSGSLENGDLRITFTDQQAASDSARVLVGPPPPAPGDGEQAVPDYAPPAPPSWKTSLEVEAERAESSGAVAVRLPWRVDEIERLLTEDPIMCGTLEQSRKAKEIAEGLCDKARLLPTLTKMKWTSTTAYNRVLDHIKGKDAGVDWVLHAFVPVTFCDKP
eukprot:jgi/Tetstr1/454175/TSEL_041094.t1